MRLTHSEIATIIQQKDAVFGKNSKIYLFGSRVDNAQKGGDIDLYIKAENKDDLFEN